MRETLKSLSYKSRSPEGGSAPCVNCRESSCNAEVCEDFKRWLVQQREVNVEWHKTDALKTLLSYAYKLSWVGAIIYLSTKAMSLVH